MFGVVTNVGCQVSMPCRKGRAEGVGLCKIKYFKLLADRKTAAHWATDSQSKYQCLAVVSVDETSDVEGETSPNLFGKTTTYNEDTCNNMPYDA